MTNDRETDPRVREFGEYLEEQILAQQQRPYSEKEDIERNLQVYNSIREAYQRTFQIDANQKLYETPVGELELCVRTKNCLKELNVRTLGDLTKMTEGDLLSYKNFGWPAVEEIRNRLASRGLSLKTG